jgi:uncharacterized integral membrane protein (TIGR00698 family)
MTTGQASPAPLRGGVVIGLVVLLLLTVVVAELDGALSAFFRGQGVNQNLLEYPLTAVVVGLIANGVLRRLGWLDRLRPAIRTELFLKIGLVLLGARISLGDLLATGAGGLIQALVLVSGVFMFTWWLGGRAKLPETLKAVMASAVAICGVSAAIAAAGAVQAKREEVSYITTLVILTALPLMILMPVLADAMNLSPTVAGAWFGGNIDTTASVVGAGTLYGAEAQQTAAIVKLAQNVLIGFVSFALALYFAVKVQGDGAKRPGPRVIWERFPKFVIGFLIVSLLATLGALSPPLVRELNTATQWLFALAFVCIGLDFSVAALREASWKPIGVYLGATVFNTVLALVAAVVIFG